jgi:hypothetical protein
MEIEPGFKLGEGNYETMRSVLTAMIADHVDVEDAPDEDRVLSELEKFMGALPPLYRMGMVWLLRALEVAPLAMGYRRQFSNLSRKDQVKVLDSFEKSSNYVQRGMIMALKSPVMMIYFCQPEMEKALGYDHRCLAEARGESK